jgi:ubiquinone/menaquinone biosynthesis C-methylase UbiE
MSNPLPRTPEPELMDLPAEVDAYAQADFAAVNQLFVERLTTLAARLTQARAIDLGTGPGDIPIRIARAKPQWRITAVDASAPMLKVAAKAIAAAKITSITLHQADAKATTLRPASFDVVFSNSILHHVSDAERFWKEVRRIAAPGAVIFLRDLLRPESELRARQIVREHAGTESALLQEEFYRSLLAAYTLEEVRGQLKHCGLDALQGTAVSDRHLEVFGEVNGEQP